jgi:hypothetical protein
MCLSDVAYPERTWGQFPALRQSPEHKDLSWEYYGPNSASDNIFERPPRVLKIGLLTRDNSELIRDMATNVGWVAIHRDIESLAHELASLGELLHSTAHEVRGLHSLDRGPQDQAKPTRSMDAG